MRIIIPMAGHGSRFQAAGYTDPKPLILVDGVPMIQHVVKLFERENNYNDKYVFICNEDHLKNTNMRNVLTNLKPNAKIISINPHKKGPVYTVGICLDEIFNSPNDDDEPTIISYCDYGTDWDFPRFLNEMNQHDAAGGIACYKGFHPHMLGKDNYAFVRENDGNILEVQEKKPFTNNRMDEYASNGTYYFSKGKYVAKYFTELMRRDIQVNGEYYISLVYNLIIQDNLKVRVFEIDHMLQWGTPYDLSVYQTWSNYFHKLFSSSSTSGNFSKKTEIKHPDGTTLVLPLAGKGNRFAVQGYSVPKPLLPIPHSAYSSEAMVIEAALSVPTCDNYSFICLANHIRHYGIDEILKNKFGSDVSVMGIDQVTQGQACTCELVVKDLDPEKPICITACDNGVLYDAEKYQKLLDDPEVDVIVWSFRNNPASVNNPNMYAWLDVDQEDNIKHVSVKKFIFDNPLKHHAIIGTMFFRKAKYFMDGLKIIYDKNIRTNGEFYVDDLLNPLIEKGLTVKVFESDFYICWGTPDDYKTYLYWFKYFSRLLNR